MQNNTPKRRGRPPKSATELGLKHAARTASKRQVKKVVNASSFHPILKLALIGAIGAVISNYINKR